MDRDGKGENGKIEARGKRQEVRGKRYYILFLASCILLLASCPPVYGADKSKGLRHSNEPAIIERVIKVEGNLERPRVIFIIPRSKLWRDDIFKKSFVDDILKPVYPKLAIKERGINNSISELND